MERPSDDPIPRVVLTDEALRAVLASAQAGELQLSDRAARRELVEWGLVHPDPVRPGIVHLTAEGVVFLDAD
jgi:hypothetical protein